MEIVFQPSPRPRSPRPRNSPASSSFSIFATKQSLCKRETKRSGETVVYSLFIQRRNEIGIGLYRGLRRAYRVVAIESTKRAVSGEGWRVSGKGHSTYGPNPGAKRSLRRTNSTPLLISDNSRNTPPSLSVVSRSLRLSTFNFGIYLSIFAPLSLSLSLHEIRSSRETWILRGCIVRRRSEERRGMGTKSNGSKSRAVRVSKRREFGEDRKTRRTRRRARGGGG